MSQIWTPVHSQLNVHTSCFIPSNGHLSRISRPFITMQECRQNSESVPRFATTIRPQSRRAAIIAFGLQCELVRQAVHPEPAFSAGCYIILLSFVLIREFTVQSDVPSQNSFQCELARAKCWRMVLPLECCQESYLGSSSWRSSTRSILFVCACRSAPLVRSRQRQNRKFLVPLRPT
jgi:hypothetical protein